MVDLLLDDQSQGDYFPTDPMLGGQILDDYLNWAFQHPNDPMSLGERNWVEMHLSAKNRNAVNLGDQRRIHGKNQNYCGH